ncbi:hypothetical protein ACP275_14G177800 [Erythranthe tilingii]
MVQKKLSKNLTLQTDHFKNENQLQDLKTKKMKKSGSIKRPDLDTTLISRRQPAKPPPPTAAAPVSPPRTTPNYMKPTTSSDARKPQTSPDSSSLRRRISNTSAAAGGSKQSKTAARALTKNPSFKPPRKFSSDSKRATCSSTLKDCKFPAFLGLNNGGTESEGTSRIKVCPYTYCSLNGHHHRPPLPPLKCFLSARRRVMNKNQRSVKLTTMQDGGLKNSLVSSPLVVEEEQNQDFFVEIYCEERVEERVENEGKSGIFVSDFELGYDCDYEYRSGEEEVENQLIDGDLLIKSDEKGGPLDELLIDLVSQESLDEDSLSSDASNEKGGPLDEFLMDKALQESLDEDSLSSDAFSTSDEDVESSDSSYDAISNQEEDYRIVENEAPFDNPVQIELCYEDPSKEPESEVALVVLKCTESDIQTAETAPDGTGDKFKKNPVEETDDELGIFDPRGPNFLDLEPGPEGEKVDLKHQDLDERKNSEEWMVDFALRQVVTKLGPARKKKVSLLVEAFEKVMPINKFDLRLRHASGFDQARQIQACN